MFDSFFKWYSKEKYASALVFIIGGLILFLVPKTSLNLFINGISLYLAIKGVVNLLNYQKYQPYSNSMLMVSGILYLIGGLFVWLNARWLLSMIPLVVGIIIGVKAVDTIMDSFNLKKQNFTSPTGVLIRGIVLFIISIYLVFNPFSTISITLRIFGLILLVNGCLEAFEGYNISKWRN